MTKPTASGSNRTDAVHTAEYVIGRFFALDFPAGRMQPSLWRFLLATIVAVVGSLAVCAVLVIVGTAVFPSTVGYAHFAFADYSRLTIIGVLVACAAWPIVTLASSKGARLFLWLAVIVTIVSLAPDAWILYNGQSAEGVLVLAVMHIAIAFVTYPALVKIAPQRRAARRS
jgi:hypothetical protein